MGSIFVLPLTVEIHEYVWLPGEADGAVVPGAKYGGSHLEDVSRVVHTHRDTFHQPLHGGCREPMEGTAALQRLLQGTRGIEQPCGCCGERGSAVSKAS